MNGDGTDGTVRWERIWEDPLEWKILGMLLNSDFKVQTQ